MDINSILWPVVSLGGMGLIFGLGLGYAGIKLKVEEDPNLPLVRDALPGANCGGCGLSGCDAFATAVIEGKAKPGGCPVGGMTTNEKISEILGIELEVWEKKSACVKCAGDCKKSSFDYEYIGLQDCNAASQLANGGAKSCAYGCLGAGSCYVACQFGAIQIIDGIAHINADLCTACGNCVSACPRKLIELIPKKSKVRVTCNSKDSGKIVKTNCSAGCIGCRLCERECQYDAIHVTNLLAKIDYNKCTLCNACAKKCPTHAIASQL